MAQRAPEHPHERLINAVITVVMVTVFALTVWELRTLLA
jgi:hypothetical protein